MDRMKKGSLAIQRFKKRIITYNTHVILRTERTPAAGPAEFRLMGEPRHAEYIQDLYMSLGRQNVFGETNLKKIVANRFANQMRFFELKNGAEFIASTWVHENGYRFFDEVIYRIKVPGRAIWLRDVFVHPDYRGNQVFKTLVSRLFAAYAPNITHIYSDTRTRNHSSIRAHSKAWFHPIGHIRVLKLFNRLLIRDALPAGLESHGGVKDRRNIIFYDLSSRKFVSENLA